MLLIFHPLTFVFFTVSKSIDTITVSLTFHVGSFISITIFKDGSTFPIWLISYHFAFILSPVTSNARTQ